MAELDDMLRHIQDVVEKNKRTETALLIMLVVMFLAGVCAAAGAIYSGNYIWTIPSLGVSVALQWPINKVERIRKRNIAILSAPIFIAQLPAASAAREIQKILQELFKEDQ